MEKWRIGIAFSQYSIIATFHHSNFPILQSVKLPSLHMNPPEHPNTQTPRLPYSQRSANEHQLPQVIGIMIGDQQGSA